MLTERRVTVFGRYVVAPGEGRRFRFGSGEVRVLSEADHSEHFAVVEARPAPAPTMVPAHVHDEHDEGFYVVDGDMEFLIGDAVLQAPSGTFVLAPRGVAHAFRNSGDHEAVVLGLYGPAASLQYLEDLGQVLPRTGTPDRSAIAAVHKQHATRFVDDAETGRA